MLHDRRTRRARPDPAQTNPAGIATAAFFVVASGTFAGLIPWLISGWEFHHPLPYWVGAQVVRVLLIVAGIIARVHAFVQFAQAGGTLIPIAPTQRLVVTGFNRCVRNSMYLGLLTVIVGQALLFGQFSLLLYAAAGWIVTASFVHWYEEPTLSRRFGAEYEGYRRAVPAWWPRLHPWRPRGRPDRGRHERDSDAARGWSHRGKSSEGIRRA
jgi:protein-S-isoprenylcysteine O-methyltransferase Ste14